MENLPFGRPGRFYRGNLHTHSTNSDGKHPPEEVCRMYKEAGYDFISLSEHFMEYFGYKKDEELSLLDKEVKRNSIFRNLKQLQITGRQKKICSSTCLI